MTTAGGIPFNPVKAICFRNLLKRSSDIKISNFPYIGLSHIWCVNGIYKLYVPVLTLAMSRKMPAHGDFRAALGIEGIKCFKFGPRLREAIGITACKDDNRKTYNQNPIPGLNECDYSICQSYTLSR